jgi:transcriptional regulator with XRE-family HTH domain
MGNFSSPEQRTPGMSLLCPEQCRAARGLLNWTQEELAEYAGVSRSTIRDFENGRHSLHPSTAAQVVAALEKGGALLIPSDDAGPGVRLQKPAI